MRKIRGSTPPKRTLEALGRVVLGFAELDHWLTGEVNLYLACQPEELAEVFTRDLRFGDKVDKFRRLINVHATKADLGTSLLIKALNNVLNRAKQSAEKRNHLVHGLVRFDRERRCFISQLKGKEITLRTNALNELAESMLRLMTDLIFLSLKLVDALAPAYDKRGIGGPFAPNG